MGEWYKNNKYNIVIVYELVMLILIIISLITVFVSSEPKPYLQLISRIIWVVFLIDVVLRIIKSVYKIRYIKKNPFDIISIIPFEDFFLLARFARVIKLFRYKNLLKRYLVKLDKVLVKYHIIQITLSMITILLAVFMITYIITDLSIITSLEWVLRNFIQFNYFSEYTEDKQELIVISVILKVLGIVYMGLLLNDIRHRIIKMYGNYKENKLKDKSA